MQRAGTGRGAQLEEDDDEEAWATPPVMGFGDWSELNRKQKSVDAKKLKDMVPGKAVALLNRNSWECQVWRPVFVVPVSRHHHNTAEVFDAAGNPIDEPSSGVANGLQPLSELLQEFGDEEF